jgi:hypothetical protein
MEKKQKAETTIPCYLRFKLDMTAARRVDEVSSQLQLCKALEDFGFSDICPIKTDEDGEYRYNARIPYQRFQRFKQITPPFHVQSFHSFIL